MSNKTNQEARQGIGIRVTKSQACSESQAGNEVRMWNRHPRKLARCVAVDMGLPRWSYFGLANILIDQNGLSRPPWPGNRPTGLAGYPTIS